MWHPRLRAIDLEALLGCSDLSHGEVILPDMTIARWNKSVINITNNVVTPVVSFKC